MYIKGCIEENKKNTVTQNHNQKGPLKCHIFDLLIRERILKHVRLLRSNKVFKHFNYKYSKYFLNINISATSKKVTIILTVLLLSHLLDEHLSHILIFVNNAGVASEALRSVIIVLL